MKLGMNVPYGPGCEISLLKYVFWSLLKMSMSNSKPENSTPPPPRSEEGGGGGGGGKENSLQ